MENIIEEIEISTNTLVILPAKAIEYCSYVLKTDGTYKVKKHPFY